MTAFTTTLMGWAITMLLPFAVLAQGIYTCIDAKGRKITSDRPIPECNDRTQNEITPSGTVRRVIGPTLTARELAALEDKEKASAGSRIAADEGRRRDRALLLRYPNQQAHDAERTLALARSRKAARLQIKKCLSLPSNAQRSTSSLSFTKKI